MTIHHTITIIITALFTIILIAACNYSEKSYLLEEIDPCSRIRGSDKDPCTRIEEFHEIDFNSSIVDYRDHPPSIDELLSNDDSPMLTIHLVVRAATLPGTTRCSIWPVVRPYYMNDPQEHDYLNNLRFLECHTNISVHEYMIGSGPPKLTVVTSGKSFFASHYKDNDSKLYETEIEAIRSSVASSTEGNEWILFISPSYTAAIEGWNAFGYWDVQRRSDGTIVAVSPIKQHYEPTPDNLALLEMPLEEFRKQIAAAHEARVAATGGRIGPAYSSGKTKRDADASPMPELPPLITDANDLHSYYRNELGAYENLTATPQLPPPVPDQ